MELSSKTARQLYEEIKAQPDAHRASASAAKPALINIDLQKAYTCVGEFVTAYETDPKQLEYVNELARAVPREAPAGGLDLRRLHGVRRGLRRVGHAHQHAGFAAEHQGRLAPLGVRRPRSRSTASATSSSTSAWRSAFFETNLAVAVQSSTRATPWWSPAARPRAACAPPCVDALSRGYRTIVPEECVADKHESPHFANLYDMALKYADVVPVAEVLAYLTPQERTRSASTRAIPASTTTCRTTGRPKIDVAERRAGRVLGRAEHRVLRARAAEEPDAHVLAAAGARRARPTRYRDYGNRVGFRRMMEAMDRCGVRGSVSLNVAVCDHHPEIIEACADARLGVLLPRHLQHALHLQHERGAGARDHPGLDRHHPASTPARSSTAGWRRRSSYTDRTLDLVAEMGLTYICDLFHDDQPGAGQGAHGPARQHALLARDERRHRLQRQPRVAAPLRRRSSGGSSTALRRGRGVRDGDVHPAASLPHRPAATASRPSRRRSRYITGHDKVWLATGREIAQHFLDHHYDAFARGVAAPRRERDDCS